MNLTDIFHKSWIEVLGKEYLLSELKRINEFLKVERTNFKVEPKQGSGLLLKAFKETPYDRVQVVMVGPEVYNDGRHNGLAFGIGHRAQDDYNTLPRELIGIVSEVDRTYKALPKSNLYLWANQGVMLLNTAHTSCEHLYYHLDLWSGFTASVFRALQEKDNIVWILPGTHCTRFKNNIVNTTHHIIETPHTAHKDFVGCGCFKECDKVLKKNKIEPVNWVI